MFCHTKHNTSKSHPAFTTTILATRPKMRIRIRCYISTIPFRNNSTKVHRWVCVYQHNTLHTTFSDYVLQSQALNGRRLPAMNSILFTVDEIVHICSRLSSTAGCDFPSSMRQIYLRFSRHTFALCMY